MGSGWSWYNDGTSSAYQRNVPFLRSEVQAPGVQVVLMGAAKAYKDSELDAA